MKAIHAEVNGTHGSRRVHHEVKAAGITLACLALGGSFMREYGINARHKRRYWRIDEVWLAGGAGPALRRLSIKSPMMADIVADVADNGSAAVCKAKFEGTSR